MQLSKSEYMMFLRQPAWLWLKKHDKAKLPPVDDNLQAMFDAGNLFESYAEQVLPGGVRVGFNNYNEYLSLPERTDQALRSGAKTIFQGRFEYKDITCIFDVITVVGEKTVDLYEIKSSTEVKQDHLLDLAFQLVVLVGAGFTVRNMFVIHVNNQYVRQGEIDVAQFTNTVNVTDQVTALREQTKLDIAKALAVANSPERPDISPSLVGFGSVKDWLEIYKNCTTVEPGSIYELANPSADIFGKLEALGIKKLADIPDDFPLNEKQAMQVKAVKENKLLLEPDKIQTFVSSFKYPLYFLDYETMSSLVPYFDGMKPYQQVPFQYSLHVLDAPGAELRHAKYLHSENSNPAQAISEALRRDIGSEGTILAWSAGFEKSCNTTLGGLAPEFKEFFEQVNERVEDLMDPFANGWYVDRAFCGSASIKKVLPVLVPELSYKDLGIHEGGSAQRLWMQSVLDGTRAAEKSKILADLDEYCTLDTMAMVKIFEKLSALKADSKPVQGMLL